MNERIKQKRIERGLTQAELGVAAGMSKSTISRIELGERSLTEAELNMIADVLEVSAKWLANGEEKPKKKSFFERLLEARRRHRK